MKKNFSMDVNKYLAAILGLVVGDALGVPGEFKYRSAMREEPITDMTAYGTHNQPAGTWSDDSSMVIATMEWFGEMKNHQPDYALLMEKFNRWITNGEYTPYGVVFDSGISTRRAISEFREGTAPLACGGTSEWDNGNGSLMRILPAALWCCKDLVTDLENCIEVIFNMSSLTHRHLRSKMACLIYSKLAADLFTAEGNDKTESVENSIAACKAYFDSLDDKDIMDEKNHFARLWDVKAFKNLEEDEIKSSGYVVHTLEAAIWCFLNTENYKDCVLKAVNLGDDTDTTAAVAGGLAGIWYGLEEIPEEWIGILPKKEWIIALCKLMVENIAQINGELA